MALVAPLLNKTRERVQGLVKKGQNHVLYACTRTTKTIDCPHGQAKKNNTQTRGAKNKNKNKEPLFQSK